MQGRAPEGMLSSDPLLPTVPHLPQFQRLLIVIQIIQIWNPSIDGLNRSLDQSAHDLVCLETSHRQGQRCALLISFVFRNPIKLIIKINHHSTF